MSSTTVEDVVSRHRSLAATPGFLGKFPSRAFGWRLMRFEHSAGEIPELPALPRVFFPGQDHASVVVSEDPSETPF